MTDKFNHVNYRWDNQKSSALGDDQIALFIYRAIGLGDVG